MADLVIRPHLGRVRILVNEHALADSSHALELLETGHAPVLYVPRDDIAMGFLSPSQTRTTCPLKGEASYYSAFFEGRVLEDLAWSYEIPEPRAAAIAGYLAFDRRQVDIEPNAR